MDEFFVRNRLSAYIDGELPGAEAREVEATLARSPSLRAEYDALRAAVTLLREHGPLTTPDGFDARLSARLAREPMPTGWRRWARAVRPEVALIAAVAAAALLYVGQNQEAPPEAVVAAAPSVEGAPEATKQEAPAAAAGEPKPALPRGADGILGDEGFAAARIEAQKEREAGPPPGAQVGPNPLPRSGVEREAYQAPWESNDADVRIVGTTVQVKPGGVADPAAQTAAQTQTGAPAQTGAPDLAQNTASSPQQNTGGATLYSPPPFRYRVRSTDEATLKELARITASLGGHLVDSQGRPVAVHMLDQGEVKTVRVFVPSGSVEALTTQLRAIGDVEIMAADASGLYASGTEVPVQVELERE